MSLAELSLSSQIAYALQLVLGAIFLISAGSKLRRPRAFRRIITQYQVVPRRASPVLADAAIVAESFLAVVFLSGELVSAGVAVASALLVAFSVAMAVNLNRGRNIPCGCFGAAEDLISWRSISRNALVLIALIALWVARPAGTEWRAVLDGGLSAVEALVAVLAFASGLVLAAAWLLSLPELDSIARPGWRQTTNTSNPPTSS